MAIETIVSQTPAPDRVLRQKDLVREKVKGNKTVDLESPRFQKAFAYIEDYRTKTIRTQPEFDKESGAIALGNARFLVPNTERFGLLFYWDSYFMMQPLLHSAEGRELARSTIEAFSTLIQKKGFIPNASSEVFLNNSQAPFFSSMIIDIYLNTPKDEQDSLWLKDHMSYAKQEYDVVWNNQDDSIDGKNGIGTHHHLISKHGLSKYGDRDGDYSLNAERESGWDFTSRFGNVAIDFLPIDLNCYLYKYEMDFAKTAELLGNPEEKAIWLARAEERKQRINTLMWNDKKGFFFDYNYRTDKQSPFYSLAPFTALWSEMATPQQAKKMAGQLERFDRHKGLMATDEGSLPKVPGRSELKKFGEHFRERVRRSFGRREELTLQEVASGEITAKQWDYPHVWAPLQHMVVVGLLNYAKNPELSSNERKMFRDTAKRLMEEYLETAVSIFEDDGTFPEKFNGITGKDGNGAHYTKQSGFGWTNAVFEEFGKSLLPQIYEEESKEKESAKSRRSLLN